ncbi:MAG: M14 family zinc carboxypeptidase, partial [Candidatus Cloacimonadaceae bacterium]|nr:M14 family zinc carboxypeptidase [Candidatus Cloacimonadaceae bacterium]
PGDLIDPIMSSSQSQLRVWDSYPTYEAYVSMMYAFATSYPNLCQIIDAGTTVNGRKILYARISDNVHLHEAEPEVAYVSTLHGDETTGYVLMLRLIDTLLSGYGSNPRLTNLVNNLDIWINPNANPDGTYYGGNSSVSGARRANANGYDLNRNFPAPNGSQYASQPRQVETTLAMNLANSRRFVLSANFHGGAEVVNYPWDHIYTLHPDNNWYVSTSLIYANSAQANSPAGYFTGISSNGITNGAAWYVITGGRQDWMGYTAKGREVTLEISNTKNPAASTLPAYWDYNYDAMLSYLEQALYGIHGTVSDPYGNPLNATITVTGHDNSYSIVSTDPAHGDFYRYLSHGTYSLLIEASGFPSATINNVTLTANQKTILNTVLGELPHAQQITLVSGWNLVSLNVVPASWGVQDVFGGLSALRQVKTNAKSYSPQMNGWFNSLTNVESGKGYWIKLDAPATLNIQGNHVNPAVTPIALNSGWNLVSYLPENSLSVSGALASILGNLQEVRYLQQSWTPTGGTLSQMEPGKAYWVKVSLSCTLIYP